MPAVAAAAIVTATTDPSPIAAITLVTFKAADAVMYAAHSDAEDAISTAQLALDAAGTSPSTDAAAAGASIAVDAAAATTEAVVAFDAAADTRAPTVIDHVPHRCSGTLSQQDQRELVKRDEATVTSWRREL